MEERIVDISEIPRMYHDLLLLSDHPVIKDDQGILRYKTNNLTNFLHDNCKFDLNKIWFQYRNFGSWTEDEFMQFYRDIGISLCGFCDIWGEAIDEKLGIKRDEETGREIE